MTTSTPTPDDARLLDAWGSQGDRAALDELVRRHWPAAHATALAVLRDPVAAEDAAQEACVALARAARRFDARRPFGPWFRTLALNAARKHLRSSGRRARHEGLAPAPSGATAGAEDRAQQAEVLEHLSRLPDRVRAPVALRFLGGCTYEEVAVALGCPKETARSRIQAGLDRLRISLQAAGCAVPLDLVAWLAGVPRVDAPSPAVPTGATIALLADGATRAGRALALALLAAIALPAALALAWTAPAAQPPPGDVATAVSGGAVEVAGATIEPVALAALAVASGAASSSAPVASPVEDRPLTVRVRDAAGAPAPGAWVAPGVERPEWSDPLVRADSAGVVRLVAAPARVWARAGIDEGFVDVGAEAREVSIVLSPADPPPPGRAAIVLLVTAGGAALPEAALVVSTEFYESPRGRPISLRGQVRTRTDDSGRALLADLRAGVWNLTVTADGCAPTFAQLMVGVDAVEEVTVPVVGAVSLRGRLLVPPGVDATTVQLELNDEGSPFEGRRVPADAEGRWRADDVHPGEVLLRARAPGLAWRYDRLHVERAPAVQEAEPLTWGDDVGALHGRLLGDDGAPLAGVDLVVVSTRREWVSTGPGTLTERPIHATLTTDADGRFFARGLPPQACVVAACAAVAEHAPHMLLGDEAPGVVARVVVPVGGDVDLGDVRAAAGPGRLRGRVLGPDGRSVPGVTVTVRCGHLPPVEVEAPDGAFVVDRLPGGPAFVTLGRGTTAWATARPIEVALGDDRVVDVEVAVVPTSALRGRVLLPPGFRGGARVLLANNRDGTRGERPLDVVGGVWAVEGLAPGTWDVSVEGVTTPLRVDLGPGERRSLDLDLGEFSVVALRVDGLPVDATSAEVTIDRTGDDGVLGSRAHGRLRGGAATLLARPGRARVEVQVWTTLYSDGSPGSPVALERRDGWRLEREATLADGAASLVVRWPAPSGVVRGTTTSHRSIEADDGAGLTAWVMASERFELALPAGRWRVRVVDEPVPGSAGGPAVEVVVAPGATIDLPAPLAGPE